MIVCSYSLFGDYVSVVKVRVISVNSLYCISINKRKKIIPQAKHRRGQEQNKVADIYYLGVKIIEYPRNKEGVGIIVKLENGEELDVSIKEWMKNISMN